MPSIGDRSYDKVWNGKAWVDAGSGTISGSSKSGEQVASELGYKKGKGADTPASGGLAGYAAKHRVRSMEEQAQAVEAAAEKQKKKQKQ